jgi:hypothetical protein
MTRVTDDGQVLFDHVAIRLNMQKTRIHVLEEVASEEEMLPMTAMAQALNWLETSQISTLMPTWYCRQSGLNLNGAGQISWRDI